MFVKLKNSHWVNARHIFIFLVYDFQLNALSNSDLKLEKVYTMIASTKLAIMKQLNHSCYNHHN